MARKKYQAIRESRPAFTLNQIGRLALDRAKAGERLQDYEIISAQLMCALTMEAVLNHIGKTLFDDWEEIERCLKINNKLKRIAIRTGLDENLLGSPPFQLLKEIFDFRDSLVHAKSSKHVAMEIREDQMDENGFPIVRKIPELMTDWEKLCNIDTAEKWHKAVKKMSSILAEAAKCHDPIKEGEPIDIWGELES